MEQKGTENILEFQHLTRRFEDGFAAVSDFNLTIKKGEFVTFLGPLWDVARPQRFVCWQDLTCPQRAKY